MIAVTVQSGDTLSGIAAAHGDSLASVEGANPGISDPNLIFAGQTVYLPSGGSWTPPSAPESTPAPSYTPPPAPVYHSSPSDTTYHAPAPSSGGLSDVPGVPSGFAACVAYRESTDGANQAYNGGVYGIITASGHDVNGQSLAAQKQAFSEIYATTGPSAWAADGCPGT